MTEPEPATADIGMDNGQDRGGSRLLRIAVALVLLGIVLIVLAGIFIDYRARVMRNAARDAAKTTAVRPVQPSKPASSTTAPTSKPAPAGKTIVVLVDAVKFRQRASGSSRILSTLRKGAKLTFIEQQGSWFHASDADGVRGWLTSSSQYVKRQ